jgi:hypothetical protein
MPNETVAIFASYSRGRRKQCTAITQIGAQAALYLCAFAMFSISSNCFTAGAHVANIFPEHAVYISNNQMTASIILCACLKILRQV